jgi:hypothetical protein
MRHSNQCILFREWTFREGSTIAELRQVPDCASFILSGLPTYECQWFGNKQIHRGVLVDRCKRESLTASFVAIHCARARFPVIPYIGPEIVEVLRASSEHTSPAFPKSSVVHQKRGDPIPSTHILSNLRHSNTLVAIIGLITRWL